MVDPRDDDSWQLRLRRDGYAHFRGLCPAVLIAEARAAIDADIATNYNPAQQIEYDNLSYCPALRRAPVLMALLEQSGIAAKLDDVIGFDRLGYHNAQIAFAVRTTRAQSSCPTRTSTGCRRRTTASRRTWRC